MFWRQEKNDKVITGAVQMTSENRDELLGEIVSSLGG
jgi:hypothetical protein